MDERHIIELNRNNFVEQVVEYGFFPEQTPACFNSKQLADRIDEVLSEVKIGKNQKEKKANKTAPVVLSSYKNGVSRRIISIINPEAFLRLAKYMSENWNNIRKYSYSDNSLSPITYLRSYKDVDDAMIEMEEINSENIRNAHKAKSDYIDGIKRSILISAGYRYRLKIDIANCYNSIYTHSITWAICGKSAAKEYHRTHKPQELKCIYDFGDALDVFMRFQKNNETNGIVVGPYTSRVFSEIVLAGIDKEFRKSGFIFKRYVDDYKFYFRTEEEANSAVQKTERILGNYNLGINLGKTQIDQFPYEIISDMRNQYQRAYEKDGVFGVLNAASLLHSQGEKGAYKYALKYIRNKEIPLEGIDTIFPLLVNVMLLDPKYGKYVTDFLKKNKSKIDNDKLSAIINNELAESTRNSLHQEALIFLHMIHELRLSLSYQNITDVLKSNNDLAIIIALDIWTHHNKLVVRTRSEAREINQQCCKLAKALESESYSGERWLLLYEIKQHKLFNKITYNAPEMPAFFTLLDEMKISFYEYKGK